MSNSHIATTYVSEVTHICVTCVPASYTFHSISLYGQPFRVTGLSETGAPNDPKNDLEPHKVKGTPYVLLISTSPKFQSVLLY